MHDFFKVQSLARPGWEFSFSKFVFTVMIHGFPVLVVLDVMTVNGQPFTNMLAFDLRLAKVSSTPLLMPSGEAMWATTLTWDLDTIRRFGYAAGAAGQSRDWSKPDEWHRGYLLGKFDRMCREGRFRNHMIRLPEARAELLESALSIAACDSMAAVLQKMTADLGIPKAIQ